MQYRCQLAAWPFMPKTEALPAGRPLPDAELAAQLGKLPQRIGLETVAVQSEGDPLIIRARRSADQLLGILLGRAGVVEQRHIVMIFSASCCERRNLISTL